MKAGWGYGSALLNTGGNENGGVLLMGNQELRDALSKQVEMFRFYFFGKRNKLEILKLQKVTFSSVF